MAQKGKPGLTTKIEMLKETKTKAQEDCTLQCFKDARQQLKDTYETCISKLLTDWKRLQEKHSEYSQTLNKIHFPATVKLNVGGHVYKTSLLTLKSDPDSMLAHMFSGRYSLNKSEDGEYFIDRDGDCFKYVLNYLRNKDVFVNDEETRLQLLVEAEFYRIDGLIDCIGYGFNGSSILNAKLKKLLFEELEKVLQKSVTGKWRMIYSAERDGWSAKDFHINCDRITPTMVLLQSDVGNIFGGFTVQSWEGSTSKCDMKSFIFNLSSKHWREPVFTKQQSYDGAYILTSPDKGPCFGNSAAQFDINICSEPQKHQCSSVCSNAYALPVPASECPYIITGSGQFLVEEMEVFTTMEFVEEEE
eukprot:gene10270-11325_t